MSEEKKETATTVVETTKTKSWLSRIGSAIVGAIIAVASTLGITSSQINAEKAKVEQVKTAATEALTAIKAGDVTTATAKLQEAIVAGKEAAAKAKEVIDTVKKADKNSVVETAKNAATAELVKDKVAQVEKAEAKVDAKAKEETKKTEVKTEVKKVEPTKTEAKAETKATTK